MSEAVQRLRKWWRGLFQPKVGNFDFTRMRFAKLDVDALVEELGLREAAEENGRHNLPDPLDRVFDGPQEKVLQYIQGHCAEAIAEGQTRLAALNRSINATNLDRVPQQIETIVADFRARAEGITEGKLVQMPDVRQRLARAEHEVERIRSRFGVDRPAKPPRRDVYTIGLILVVWLAQAGLNTYFFALGHEMGLIGGLLFALILAATDVAIATALGVLGRHVSVRGGWRWAGAAGLTAGILWIPTFNLVAAHFREALQGMAGASTGPITINEASRVALDSFVAAPWGLEALDSWLLCALGALFSALAYGTAWKLNDPVPGYGDAQRELDEVREEHDEILDGIAEELREAAPPARKQLDAVQRDAGERLDSLRATIDSKETLLKNLKDFVDHVERSCNALITVYRDANRQHRTMPAPEYFHERWEYPRPAELEDDTSQDHAKLEAQQRIHDELSAHFERAYDEIEQIVRSQLQKAASSREGDEASGVPMLRPLSGGGHAEEAR